MSNTSEFQGTPPHIAFFPSAGMGHLTPFLRLATMLASRGCIVTLITVKPTVSAAESTHISAFFSTFPHIKRLELQILPFLPSNPTTDDPFFIQFEAIHHSVHLLRPLLLSSSPPLSAIFSDLSVTTSISQIADDLCIPNYIVCTSCARFLALLAYLPFLVLSGNTAKFSSNDNVEIPGLPALPISSIPLPFFNPNHPFTALLTSNTLALPKAKGVIINTFNSFETETITALNNGRDLSNITIPLLPVGPLEPCYLDKDKHLPWLDKQSAESIVYVSFGSRTTMSKDQIKELGNGLQRSGHGFLWVIKGNKVDKDDSEELEDLLGKTFLERTKNKGMVIKGWADQEKILAHPAIGVFVSHCGWNSVMEAAQVGLPVLAWPQHGDQKINAEVAVKAGLGMWIRDWGWGGERLVNGEEIAEKIAVMMGDENLRNKARMVCKEAKKAGETGGTSEKVLMEVIEMLKHKH